MPNDKPTGSVNMAYAAQSNDFTDFYVNFFNSDNTSTKRMEPFSSLPSSAASSSESCSSDSLTDFKTLVYDNDLLNLDLDQCQIKQEYGWHDSGLTSSSSTSTPPPQQHDQKQQQQLIQETAKQKARPGRKAKLPDSFLSPLELEKRELRRTRNKQAARRCRQRRLEKTFTLEQKVTYLHTNNVKLESENIVLRRQVEHLQKQLQHQQHQQNQQNYYQAPSGVISEVDHRNAVI